MATVWTLTLGTSFDLKSGGKNVANFTEISASLPGTLNTGNTITAATGDIKATSGSVTAKTSISNDNFSVDTNGNVKSSGSVVVKNSSKQPVITLATNGKITSSGDLDTNGNAIKGGAITASGAIDAGTNGLTCGAITASGDISASGNTVSCGTVSTTDFSATNLTADSLDIASSKFKVDSSGNLTASASITSSGAIKGKGLEGTSLNVKTGKITCGAINSSGKVSAENGFYVE